MKNSSKKKYSENNQNNYRKNSNNRNFSNSKNYSFEEKNNNNFGTKSKASNHKNEFSNSKFKNKNKFNSLASNRRTFTNNYYSDSSNILNNDQSNKRNFDDWIWGKHSAYSALASERAINRIWCTSEIFSSEKFYILLKDLKSKGVLIEEVSWNRLSQLTYGATHQGIALQIAHSSSIPLTELINKSKKYKTNPIILALDGITDPHNLGAIIRSAEAFDCKGIVIPQRRSAGLTGTVAKVAAGALEFIPISRVVNLNRALEELKKNGFLILGLSGDGQLPISKFNENSPLVVIIGSEDKGISLLTQKKCDFILKIPLKGKTSSLNASVAAAISLFSLTNK